jgi:putative ATP-dependent endonuclease of the OLD family
VKIRNVELRNFRRLEKIKIDFEAEETVFVGPNNSGKTSATSAFRLFLIRQDFKVHDFSVSKIAALDAFGAAEDADKDTLPTIDMDLWFKIDPTVEFGRVFSLIPNVSASLEEVGIRLKYCVKDAKKLKAEYQAVFPSQKGEKAKKPLSHYLSLPGNLSRHFGLAYFALEKTNGEPIAAPLEPEEGKRVLRSLVRVDFVDAQRNIDDHEIGRSNRLSTAFAAFYKKNLEQAAVNEEANRIIDENNSNLTEHYDQHFKELMEVIKELGVPSVNDRQMKIVSSLSPEIALQGNTSLLYIDPTLNHELPEAYNGLGFKNLVYMAIQISHFHMQWMRTEEKRPLCQIIFIEEPEVHLHAQVQQTFISNMWKIIEKASKKAGESHMVPQLAITTHSSHILDTVDFGKVRYFRRCVLDGEDPTKVITFNASKVLNLRDFKPQKKSAAGEVENEGDTLNFLQKYLKLTHCDLFFADAAILVEGTSEKLLLPTMIEQCAAGLKSNYITALEVGGAYASRFASLLEFIGLPYLVITDIDSVDPADNRKVCRADKDGAVTSNASLKFFLNKTKVTDFTALEPKQQILADGFCYVAFQRPVSVEGHAKKGMHGRTFEETFVYENMQIFRDKKIDLDTEFPKTKDFEEEHNTVFERVKSSSFKKTEFALNVASSKAAWKTPQYIADGLNWLAQKMTKETSGQIIEKASNAKAAKYKG